MINSIHISPNYLSICLQNTEMGPDHMLACHKGDSLILLVAVSL